MREVSTVSKRERQRRNLGWDSQEQSRLDGMVGTARKQIGREEPQYQSLEVQ